MSDLLTVIHEIEKLLPYGWNYEVHQWRRPGREVETSVRITELKQKLHIVHVVQSVDSPEWGYKFILNYFRFKDEPLNYHFRCDKCAKTHKMNSYAIAQRAMNVKVVFTCECGNKINL